MDEKFLEHFGMIQGLWNRVCIPMILSKLILIVAKNIQQKTVVINPQ